ncbi:MAG: benzoyl-CoA 2,3-epoxidase subunit BoxB, partial [Pseudomonadota bacterium]
GIKGRYMEHRLDDDHKLNDATYPVVQFDEGNIFVKDVPALTAINMRLRDDYKRDASGGLGRWNKLIAKIGVDFEMKLPHEGFNRAIGVFANKPIDPDGKIISQEEYDSKKAGWLPDSADGDFIQSLMVPCYEPGEYAGWIAPPKVGIDNKPGDFEYVKLHMA